MKNKKLIFLLIVLSFVFMTGCSKENDEPSDSGREKEREEERVEVDVTGTYIASRTGASDGVDSFDDYFVLKEDGTFFKQSNYCSGILHFSGTYKVEKVNDGVVTIVLVVSDDETEFKNYFEIEDGAIKLVYKDERPVDYYGMLTISCNGNTWIKSDPEKAQLRDELVCDDYKGCYKPE